MTERHLRRARPRRLYFEFHLVARVSMLSAIGFALAGDSLVAQTPTRWSGSLLATHDGHELTAESFAIEVGRDDIVFLGEEHDNDAGHAWQLAIVRALHAQGIPLAISVEMFERDVQGSLDDYLQRRISEDDFRQSARPWPNYAKHYRPILEFARRHRIPVIAANVPRSLASQMARGQSIDLTPASWRPRSTSAPEDLYWHKFLEAMSGHGGADLGDAVRNMYASQCLKDDAMAEAIADFMDLHRHRRVLVVHLCGKFHSDFGLGTVDRLRQRQPLARVTVVTMESAPSVEHVTVSSLRERGHYAIIVPPNKQSAPAK